MNNDIIAVFELVSGTIGEGAGTVVLLELFGRNIGMLVSCCLNEVPLVNHGCAKRRVIKSADSEDSLDIVGRDMEVSATLGNGIRVISCWEEFDRTGMLRVELFVVMEHVQLISACSEGTSVYLSANSIRIKIR